MSFEPNPQQTLLIFSMLLGETPEEREPLAAKTNLKAAVRDKLIEKKLIGRTAINARSFKLHLTIQGKDWALSNLFCRLPERSPRSKLILARLRLALEPILKENRDQIERLLERSNGKGTDKSKGQRGAGSAPEPDELTLESIQQQIRDAYFSLTHGKAKERVLLRDLRPKVSAVKSDFDEAALALQRADVVVLMGLDNIAERTPDVEAAALHIAGNPRHLVYFQG